MFNGIKTILFTTNLSKNCVPAFDLALIMALRFKAKLIMLHVMEKIPDYVESRLQGLLGENQWESMIQAYENEARQKLIGKRSTSTLIQKALDQYCKQAGIESGSDEKQLREVVIDEGDVCDCIIKNADTRACDLIVLGDQEQRFMVGPLRSTTKSVLRQSKMPVVIVPVDPKERASLKDLSSWSS